MSRRAPSALAVTRKKRIVAFLRQHIHNNGYPPTIREISVEVGNLEPGQIPLSTSVVAYYLRQLEEEGQITRNGRSLRRNIVPAGVATAQPTSSSKIIRVPIIGKLQSNMPLPPFKPRPAK